LTIIPIFGNYIKKAKFVENLEQMSKNTSISLGDYFDNFIQSSLQSGRFKNASEVIRAGLRLLEEEENKLKALQKAIQEGVDSGLDTGFNPELHLKSLKQKKANG